MVSQNQRKLFRALSDCADEFLEDFFPETSAPTKVNAWKASGDHATAMIAKLNQADVMVSIDYEPGNTYSVSLLRKDTKLRDCWSTQFLVRSAGDLTDTLRKGAQKLGISL